MAYITGIFQGQAKNVKVGQTKTEKRKIDFDFVLQNNDKNEEKVIHVLLLNEEAEIEEGGLVRIEGKLELNIWNGNASTKILSSNTLDVEGETPEGSITGSFRGYANYVKEGKTNNDKRKVTCSMGLSAKDDEGTWHNDNISVTLLNDEENIEENTPVGFEGSLSLNTWDKDGELQKNLQLLSYNLSK
jgi:hypothetical protein